MNKLLARTGEVEIQDEASFDIGYLRLPVEEQGIPIMSRNPLLLTSYDLRPLEIASREEQFAACA